MTDKKGLLVEMPPEVKNALQRVSKETGVAMAAIALLGINEEIARHERRKLAKMRLENPGLICWYCDAKLPAPGADCTNPNCEYSVSKMQEAS